jgi:hypothetical protein
VGISPCDVKVVFIRGYIEDGGRPVVLLDAGDEVIEDAADVLGRWRLGDVRSVELEVDSRREGPGRGRNMVGEVLGLGGPGILEAHEVVRADEEPGLVGAGPVLREPWVDV